MYVRVRSTGVVIQWSIAVLNFDVRGFFFKVVEQKGKLRFIRKDGFNIRSLGIFAATPHNNISGAGLCAEIALVGLVASRGFLEEAHGGRRHATKIAACVR